MSGGRIQVVAQLIDARSDRHVWADTFLRDFPDLLVVQNEISHQVAREICGRLSAGIPGAEDVPKVPEPAMRDYLRGRQYLSRRTAESLRLAEKRFAAVVSEVPGYAPAWASRAETDMLLAHYGAEPVRDAMARSRRHSDRALIIDPDLPMAIAQRGALAFFFDRDFVRARDDLARALELQPNYTLAALTLANLSAINGQWEEALDWVSHARAADPLDVGVRMNEGDHLILQRRYQEAARALGDALHVAPGHEPCRLRMAWARALAGDVDAATEISDEATASGPQALEYGALVAAALGNQKRARASYGLLAELAGTAYVSSWALARAAAAAGDIDCAFAALERAVRESISSLVFVAVTPAFDALHGDPRFANLLHRLDLQIHAPPGSADARV